MKLLLIFLLLSLHFTHQQKVGCLVWQNNYINFQNVSESPDNQLIKIEAFSKYLTGWFGISFSKNKTLDASSILIYASYPNLAFQTFNHSTIPHTQSDAVKGPQLLTDIQYILANKKGIRAYLNVTHLKGMKYFTFAFGEDGFVNHATQMFSFDILEKSKDFSFDTQDCSGYLGVPGRVFGYHLLTFYFDLAIHIFLMFLFFYFRNHQPLNSRKYAPLLSTFGLSLNLIFETMKVQFDYEWNVNNVCYVNFYVTYPLFFLPYCTLTYIYMHFVFAQSFIWIQEKINKKAIKGSKNNIGEYKKIPIYILFLKKLKNPIFILIFIFVIFLVQISVFSVVLAIGGFKCTKLVNTLGTYVQGLCFVFASLTYFFAQLLDIVRNYYLFWKCKLRRFFYDDDVYYFRMEVLLCFIFIPIGLVWALVPLPDFIQTIIVELLVCFFLVILGGFFSLGVTIYRYYFPPKMNKSNGDMENVSEIDEIFQNQALFELFYEYSKKEFSMENVLYKVDSDHYKKIKNEKKRLKLAQQMEIKYMSGDSSPLEINADLTTMRPIKESLQNKLAPVDLFKQLDVVVMKNLSDTHGRFKFSRLLKDFRRKSINTLNAIADRRESGVEI